MKPGNSAGKRRLEQPERTPKHKREHKLKSTVLGFFTPVDGPTAAPANEGPVHLFPAGERTNTRYVKYNKGERPYYVSKVTADGKLMGGCACCTKKSCVDILQFAPRESNNNFRRLPVFLDAVDAFKKAYAARDLDAAREARARVEKHRIAYCLSCQKDLGHNSPEEQACKDEYESMRKAACAKNGGCAHQSCAERGEEAWCVLEGDHLNPESKTHALGDYKWWSWNGGVKAMRAEEAKGVQWICRFCHRLKDTSSSARRHDPDTMPDGRQGMYATEEEIQQYAAKRQAKIRYPKYMFVDRMKRAVGHCEVCGRTDVAGKEVAFDFHHKDETTKMKGQGTLAGVQGGVGGICCNSSKKAALDYPGVEETIVDERKKCALTCCNCHHRHTWGYPMRSQPAPPAPPGFKRVRVGYVEDPRKTRLVWDGNRFYVIELY